MSGYLLTPRAKTDIFAIWSYIAEDSETAAEAVERAIYSACEFIASSPSLGHARRDLTSFPVRFWTVPRYPSYSIIYKPDTSPVRVVAVLHGRREARRILTERL